MFNLIVGTGVLALPAILAQAGWALGSLFMAGVACLSLLTITFVIEAMAVANALLLLRAGEQPEPLPLPAVPAAALRGQPASGFRLPLTIACNACGAELSRRLLLPQARRVDVAGGGCVHYFACLNCAAQMALRTQPDAQCRSEYGIRVLGPQPPLVPVPAPAVALGVPAAAPLAAGALPAGGPPATPPRPGASGGSTPDSAGTPSPTKVGVSPASPYASPGGHLYGAAAGGAGGLVRPVLLRPLMDDEDAAEAEAEAAAAAAPGGARRSAGGASAAGRPLPDAGAGRVSIYEIRKQTEIGTMVDLFFPAWGRAAFWLAFVAYLFGDLTIYVTVVCVSLEKFLAEVAPGAQPVPFAFLCAGFCAAVLPLCLCDFRNARPLQVATMMARWLAFWAIIGLSCYMLLTGSPGPFLAGGGGGGGGGGAAAARALPEGPSPAGASGPVAADPLASYLAAGMGLSSSRGGGGSSSSSSYAPVSGLGSGSGGYGAASAFRFGGLFGDCYVATPSSDGAAFSLARHSRTHPHHDPPPPPEDALPPPPPPPPDDGPGGGGAPSGPIVLPAWNFRGLPNLFGGVVYAFMCHHSIPGAVAPARDKSALLFIVSFTILLVFITYMGLFLSTALAFGPGMLIPITANFATPAFGWFGIALVLYPVFALGANYPLMAITLRNNLDALIAGLWAGRTRAAARAALVVAGAGGPATRAAARAAPSHSLRWKWVERGHVTDAAAAATAASAAAPLLSGVEDDAHGDMHGDAEAWEDPERGVAAARDRAAAAEADAALEAAADAATSKRLAAGSASRRVPLALLICTLPCAGAVAAREAGLDIAALVGIAGAYGGCMVMFVVPACLVHAARAAAARELPATARNPHASPARGAVWVGLTLLWAGAVVAMITALRMQ